MQRVGDARLVRTHAANLDGIRRICRTSCHERGAGERDDMVPSREDEVPDQTLVAVDDEVPAKFGGLLVPRDECGRGETPEVAPV